MANKIKLGDRIDRWVIEAEAPSTAGGRPRFWCRCVCGTYRAVSADSLTYGQSRSCGCLGKEQRVKRNTTHGDAGRGGQARHPLYNIWNHMRSRCRHSPNYAGRGISVCAAWQDYVVFREWARANGWRPGLTLDRINGALGYQPDNCRWVTRAENARNRRPEFLRLLTAWGETKCLAAWLADPRCRVTGGGLIRRLEQGVPPEAALGTEPRSHRKRPETLQRELVKLKAERIRIEHAIRTIEAELRLLELRSLNAEAHLAGLETS